MKQLVAILLLAGILFQTFNRVIILADYEINKEFIAKNLCENKNKPKLHCNGKCHMMKKMAKEEKRDNSPVNNLKNKSQFQLYSETKTPLGLVFEQTSCLCAAELSAKIPFAQSTAIFHPPKV